MQRRAIFHEDVFYEYFRPFRHPLARFDIWGGHGLGTFGEDFQIVLAHPKNFVWTVVDGENGAHQWITTGVNYVNRVCYLLTEVPHDWTFMEFRIERNAHSLTPLGLKRRIRDLQKLLHNGTRKVG